MRVGNCDQCSLSGDPVHPHGWTEEPDIAFVGEAPGAEEERRGRPFVGRAGKLLREALTLIDFDLERIYYTNACLCRPPKNRDPRAKEMRACNGRLLEELSEVKPRIVVPLGNIGINSLLGGGRGITKRRGIYQEAHGHRIIPTLHPAGVLRSPESFVDLVADLEYIKSVLDGEEPVINPPRESYVIIETQEGFDALIKRLRDVGKAAIDLETASLDFMDGHILSVGFTWARGTACVLDWQALVEGNLANFKALRDTLANIDCYFHNGQFDVLWLRAKGICPRFVGDTMLMHYAIDERQGSHGLKRLSISRYRSPEYDDELKALIKAKRSARENGEKGAVKVLVDEKDRKAPLKLSLDDWADDEVRRAIMEYNGADSDYTLRLSEDLRQDMVEDDVSEVHEKLLVPAASHFIDLELSGMLVDIDYHDAIGAEWSAKIEELEGRIRSYEGAEEINLNSPKQIAEFIFDHLGLIPMVNEDTDRIDQDTILQQIQQVEDPEAQEYWRSSTSHIFTDMKPRSTSTYMLYWLAQQHEWPRLIVEHREYSKLHGAYYQGYKDIMWKDGRIRPRYRVHGTRTGRLSSTDPNIHGMPRQKVIKDIFTADPGYTLIHADYSQAEIRMMAHFAKDDKLIEALHETDIHRAISRELFNLSEDELDALPEEEVKFKRRAAKTIAFGLIYGRSAKSLAPQLSVSLTEAEAYMKKFFQMMPGVTRWIARQKDRVLRDQEVTSLYGRKRRFPIILDRGHANEVKRQAVNMPIQSSVSDMTLLANLRVMETLRSEGISVRPWPHIHDGFLIQVPSHLVKPSTEILIDVMHDVDFETDVPFSVEVDVGRKWGDMETIYEG